MYTYTVILLLLAIGAIATTSLTTVYADINNPKKVSIEDSDVVINIGAGKDGEDGEDGAQGPPGEQGPEGPAGPQGEQGVPGIPGVNGTNGVDGQDGRDGTNGTSGVDGQDGKDGMNATATVFLNSTNGQQVVCTVSPPQTVSCVEVNATSPIPEPIPPVDNQTGNDTTPIPEPEPPVDNQTGNDTVPVPEPEPPVDNQTGNETNGGNVTIPVNGNVTITPDENDTGFIPEPGFLIPFANKLN